MSVASAMDKFSVKQGIEHLVVLRIGIFAAFVLVALAGGAALALVQGIERQSNDMVRGYEVRNQARELSIALSEVEGGLRGYILTGEATYRESYQRAMSNIEMRIQSLKALSEDDLAQAGRVEALVLDVANATANSGDIVDLVQEQKSKDARSFLQSASGTRLADDARRSVEQFVSQQNADLADRSTSAREWRRLLLGCMVAALLGAVTVSYVLFERTRQEVSNLRRARSDLVSANQSLEARVSDRTQDLEEARMHAEQERQRAEVLLQDASHRIGNSLATVSSLLSLQVLRSPSPEVRDALEAARGRVHAVASAHRRLRLGHDLETVDADEFLSAVLQDLSVHVSSTNKINLVGQFETMVISARDATTLGILLGELVTNAIKHAFRKRETGSIRVRFERVSGVLTLSVADDGNGLQPGQSPGEGGLGSVVIRQLAHQFGGAPLYEKPEQGGLRVVIPMPGLSGKESKTS